jgi:hypothetical protein
MAMTGNSIGARIDDETITDPLARSLCIIYIFMTYIIYIIYIIYNICVLCIIHVVSNSLQVVSICVCASVIFLLQLCASFYYETHT